MRLAAGTETGLADPVVLNTWITDFEGAGSKVRTIHADDCGDYLQLLDERTCLTSEVVRLPPPEDP